MKFIKYPSIEQFRSVVRKVRSRSEYLNQKNPIIEFNGSVKLHGTNGGIGWDGKNLWCQSRNNILDIHNTNNGFYIYVMNNISYFSDLLNKMLGGNNQVILFGEWCGEGIQKGVALTNLEKMFVGFGVMKTKSDIDFWDNEELEKVFCEDIKLYNINMFKNYSISVDTNNPEKCQNLLVELVGEVEKECPVGKYFGVSGVGEGIVFSGEYQGIHYVFKAKGQKHSVSKTKTVVPVDIEKINSSIKFAEYAVTRNRVLQAVQETNSTDEKDTGKVIKWVMCDISKEELDTLLENNLSMKDVQSKCCNLIRDFYFSILDEGI